MKMFEMLKKDSFLLGALLGVLLPALAFVVIFGIDYGIRTLNGAEVVLEQSTMVLISIFVNLFTMRYYLVSLKSDKTGRGILMVTFLLAMVFFYVLFRT